MSKSLQSLVETGTKLYLDSVAPEEVDKNLQWGAVGATSNPAIIAGIVQEGGLDSEIESLLDAGHDDAAIAWKLTDKLVREAQDKFLPIWQSTKGNAGWVSFELDPLLEDPEESFSDADRTERYVELGKQWSEGHQNRMIKVPATPAGLAALEPLAAAGVTLNVTLIFTLQQYRDARDAVWKGAQQRSNLEGFKSVYSIFISRIDVYTASEVPELSDAAQGQVGILNAKRAWAENQAFWRDLPTTLEQEMIFASTGVKTEGDKPWRYVQALAGSDIQTNPPETNEAIAENDLTFTRTVDQLPDEAVQKEIDQKVEEKPLYDQLMAEGVAKFVKPQRALLKIIAEKRAALTTK
ncbi:transaldolase family protein [Roseimaritima sediminicola]|uniref:transaldolase family protein n=1 Tax=Roseimaritima sediminicola TaxID=2662066 RepID=UPI0012984D60|nr:transaldolase family protein [Roseimaritima sediminicola]